MINLASMGARTRRRDAGMRAPRRTPVAVFAARSHSIESGRDSIANAATARGRSVRIDSKLNQTPAREAHGRDARASALRRRALNWRRGKSPRAYAAGRRAGG
ncbi:hypothetical protein [Lysobacter gummosus]|uniref:hypothetical protein n=1 Tax=Lysobacter gummosus TaxID=262324 RepID=UPI00362E1963